MKFKNAGNPSEYSIMSFYALSDSALTGIAENSSGVIPVKVFPNPFNSTAVVSLKNYRLVHGNIPLDFIMYDLLGNAVLHKDGITANELTLNRNGLHAGMYFYKVMNGGREEAFGRISIQ